MDKMMSSSIQQAKNVLRKEMKVKLSKILDDQKKRQSQIVCQKVLNHKSYRKSERIAVFLSMNDEINTEPILKDILGTNKSCFIPYYEGAKMNMLQLKSWEDYLNLPETKWKIKQPASKEDQIDALKTGGLDLIFVPGLAFTEAGERLGRGKGYYDKFLRECEMKGFKPILLGLAFSEQICSDVPTNDDDYVIDEILHP